MAIVDSLFTVLGYEFEDDDLKKYAESTKFAEDLTKQLAKAATIAATAITGITVASAQSTDQTAKNARQVKVAVDQYDALSFAAEQATGTSDNLFSSLETFSVGIGEAARGTGSALEAFGILGVQLTDANGEIKDTNSLLLESADALNALEDEGQRLELADKLGLKELDLLLREGSGGIRALTEEARSLGVVTEEDAKAAEAFNDEWNRFMRVVKGLVREFATQLLPLFTEFTETFRAWVKENRQLLTTGIVTFFNNLEMVFKALGVAIAAIAAIKLGTFIIGLVKVFTLIKKIGLAALLMQAKVLAIPLLIGAAAIAAALLIEDIWVALQGGDSVIGDVIERLREFDIFNDVIAGVTDLIEIMVNAFTGMWEAILNKDALAFFDAWLEGATSLANFVSNVLFAAFEKIIDLLREFEPFNNIIEGAENLLDKGGDLIGGAKESVSNFVDDPVGAVGNLLGFNQGAAVEAAAVPAVGNTSTTNNSTTGDTIINVNGGDLSEVRRVVEGVINDQTKSATQELQSNRSR